MAPSFLRYVSSRTHRVCNMGRGAPTAGVSTGMATGSSDHRVPAPPLSSAARNKDRDCLPLTFGHLTHTAWLTGDRISESASENGGGFHVALPFC